MIKFDLWQPQNEKSDPIVQLDTLLEDPGNSTLQTYQV